MFQTKLNDTQLWEMVRQSDEAAYTELFNRYWMHLYKTAYKYLNDKEASEEVVNDVFLAIWIRRSKLEISSFSNYMLSATRFQSYNKLRAVKLPLVYAEEQGNAYFKIAQPCVFQDLISERDIQENIHQYLVSLPKRCREIFCMSRLDNLSNQEIALRLGISKRTVENQITIALKHLRVNIQQLVY